MNVCNISLTLQKTVTYKSIVQWNSFLCISEKTKIKDPNSGIARIWAQGILINSPDLIIVEFYLPDSFNQ